VKLDAMASDAPRRVGHSSNEMTHMRGRLVLKNQAIEEVKALGVVRIDIVLANAGIFPAAEEGMFKDLTAETAEQVWRVNVGHRLCDLL
jgi:NAD(P)-dependent dehydrogenase (short-subunit alcohol dehydrogenase family)